MSCVTVVCCALFVVPVLKATETSVQGCYDLRVNFLGQIRVKQHWMTSVYKHISMWQVYFRKTWLQWNGGMWPFWLLVPVVTQ